MSISQPKILCLFSAPLLDETGEPINGLDIRAERDAIVKELTALNRQITVRINFATIEALVQGIRDGFNILHFSGHGSKEFLAFEDGKGGCHFIDGNYLKRLIGAAGPFELAVISACYSENIGKLVNKAGVRHVVAIKRGSPILDHAAIKFAGSFYGHLLNGDNIHQAFQMATLMVEGDPDLSKIKPFLEAESCQNGKPFIPEEKKFILIPSGKPSFHQKSITKDIPRGVLTIEELKKAEDNLPVRPQSFTGRSKETYEIINELLANRFVTITGAGGIGKTTIALEVARWFHLRGHFPDGIFILDLRKAGTSNRIIDLIANCVGTQFEKITDVVNYLQKRHMLLLLDNGEEVLFQDEKGTQGVTNEILRFAPYTKILMTSQRPAGGNLHEPERVYRIGIMNGPDSTQLFLATSKRVITEEEPKSVAFLKLLRQLGGHPLSIVLMARQLTHGTEIQELVERITISKAKAVLVRGISDVHNEHGESLIASLSTSFSSLDEPAKELFISLSMLPSGAEDFGLKAIFGEESWESAQKLNDASLAEIRRGRITLLPPIRLFAESILTEEIRRKYGPKIVRQMAIYAGEFYGGFSQRNAKYYRTLFALEEPNLRKAVELPSDFDDESAGKRQCSHVGVLAHFLIELYYRSSRPQEAVDLRDLIIPNLIRLADQECLARVFHAYGCLKVRLHKFEEAKDEFEAALKIFQEITDKNGEANTLAELGDVYMRMDKQDKAEEILETALRIFQSIDESLGEANTLSVLGKLYSHCNRLEEAKDKLEAALKIYQGRQEKVGEAAAMCDLGDVYLLMEKPEISEQLLRTALNICQEIGYKLGEANTLRSLGDVYWNVGELEEAKEKLKAALKLYVELKVVHSLGGTLALLGIICLEMSSFEEAKKRLEEALEIYQKIGDKVGRETVIEMLKRFPTQ